MDQEERKDIYLNEKLVLLREILPDKFIEYEEYIMQLYAKEEGN
ncbi:hypothetical protein [Metaclostridioides mangenotii]|nr:hypothetical protein [Clostridioides mangenotii]